MIHTIESQRIACSGANANGVIFTSGHVTQVQHSSTTIAMQNSPMMIFSFKASQEVVVDH
jgi:hypothetical protein